MRKIAFLLFSLLLLADNYSLRLGFSQASKNDFGQILYGETTPFSPKTYTSGLDIGYLLENNYGELPIDIYIKSGVNYFIEPKESKNFFEGILFLKLYYSFFNDLLRLGLGEGFSYTFGQIAYVERIEAIENSDNNSNYLNYLEVSYDINIGKLFSVGSLNDLYIGYNLKHRSGIYGLINNVRRGGSNYNMITVEKNF